MMATFKPRTHARCALSHVRTPALAALASFAAILAGGCAHAPETQAPQAESPAIQQAADRYLRCVRTEAEKSAANPAGAEDIAIAAHASCWNDWDAYRQAINSGYTRSARTREEKQLGGDKADAHLRQFEIETRRGVVQSIVERTLTKKP